MIERILLRTLIVVSCIMPFTVFALPSKAKLHAIYYVAQQSDLGGPNVMRITLSKDEARNWRNGLNKMDLARNPEWHVYRIYAADGTLIKQAADVPQGFYD